MEVVVGTYEELLLAYTLRKNDGSYTLHQSFTDHSHSGCVKAVAISKKGILASGGTDEIIRLYNLKKRTELGCLMQHDGTVTCLEFYQNSHLFSGSDDKTMCVWKSFTWECLRTLKGHKGSVNCLSIHPSGKMALTVSQDKTLKTWNLLTGKCAYITNLKLVADLVRWSPDGSLYVVLISSRLLDIYSVQSAQIQCSVSSPYKVNCIAFLNNDILLYGGEGGDINVLNIQQNKTVCTIPTQSTRIKGIVCTESEDGSQLLFTAASDGHIKVYGVENALDEVKHTLLAEVDTKFRLTCIAVSPKLHSDDDVKKEEASDTVVIDSANSNPENTSTMDTQTEKVIMLEESGDEVSDEESDEDTKKHSNWKQKNRTKNKDKKKKRKLLSMKYDAVHKRNVKHKKSLTRKLKKLK